MCDGTHNESDGAQAARELKLMRQTFEQLRINTLWTALGAASGWAGVGVALYVIFLAR